MSSHTFGLRHTRLCPLTLVFFSFHGFENLSLVFSFHVFVIFISVNEIILLLLLLVSVFFIITLIITPESALKVGHSLVKKSLWKTKKVC